jgi:hypothetical protein
VIEREKMAIAPIARKERSESAMVAPCANPKAAPELRASSSWRKLPMISLGPLARPLRAMALEPLSTAITIVAIRSKD